MLGCGWTVLVNGKDKDQLLSRFLSRLAKHRCTDVEARQSVNARVDGHGKEEQEEEDYVDDPSSLWLG